ncbi:MAG: hypothetical protein HY445_03495 [Candidatus Niyogibacteria bacterium]|nr:hypothetical protein [Candidatus Niyogibacteria bacterium]
MKESSFFSLVMVLFLLVILAACLQPKVSVISETPGSVVLKYMNALQQKGDAGQEFRRKHGHGFRVKVRDMQRKNPREIWDKKEGLLWNEHEKDTRHGQDNWRKYLAAVSAIEHIETRNLSSEECLARDKDKEGNCPVALVFIKVSFFLSVKTPIRYHSNRAVVIKNEYLTGIIFKVGDMYEVENITPTHSEAWPDETKGVKSILFQRGF